MDFNFGLDYFNLAGKVAIVTGGNKGIGEALSFALARAGANLFIVTHGSDIQGTKKLIEKTSVSVHFHRADLKDENCIDGIIEECISIYGRIDILVNNAGTIRRAPLLEHSDEDWKDVIDINLNSVYYLSKRVANVMSKNGSGKIINIASMLSFQGGKFVPGYTASKHAIAGLTKSFANELACMNIQVNAIAPGYIETANTASIRDDVERNNEILSRIPSSRWGEVSDLMGAVVYLSSKASDYVNGHILVVDGGWLVR